MRPFTPGGYSFWQTTASDLGDAGSPVGPVFSLCILGLGVIMVIAAFTLPGQLRQRAVPLWLAVRPGIGLISGALITFSAGFFPQPHPNHAGGALGARFILLPVLIPLAIWRVAPMGLRIYLDTNLVFFVGIAILMADLLPVADPQAQGFVQKLFTLTVFVPPAIVAATLARAPRTG